MAAQTRPLVEPAIVASPAARRAARRAAIAEADGSGWAHFAVLAIVGGSVAVALASVSGHPEWRLPSVGVAAALALGSLALAARARSRSRRAALVAERIAPLVGLSYASAESVARLVRARWPFGARRSDPPRRVTVRPPASCRLSDPTLLDRIADTAGRAFRIDLRVATVHRRRHEVVLVPTRLDDAGAAEATSKEVRCAEVVVEQWLGVDAKIVATTFADETTLESLEVRFTPTAHNTEPRFWTQFEAAFNRQVPGRWHAVADPVADPITRQAGCHIERRATMPTRTPYGLDRLRECGRYEIPYALDERARLVTWALDLSPHMVVSGPTRSGKSNTIRAVVRGFIARGWPALVCDPRRTGLLGMRGWPGVQTVATTADPRHMVAVIEHVHIEMSRREAALESGLTSKGSLEPLLLVLDEYGELHARIRRWWTRRGARAAEADPASDPPVFDLVDVIARLGGEVGVHLLVGVKRPDVDATYLPAELWNDCRSRCSHGALTREEAEVMWGNPATGRSVPPMVQGRATATRADGMPGEVQVLWLPDPLELSGDDVELYRSVEPAESPHPWLKDIDGYLRETDARPDTPWAEIADRRLDAPSPDQYWEWVDAGVHEESLRYGDAERVLAAEVAEADLIEVEDGSNVWIVVDHVATDPVEPDLLYIDGRVVDSGQPKTIVAAEDAMVLRRRQSG